MLRRVWRGAALALAVCSPLLAEVRALTILHTNDVHARISPAAQKGGFAYLAAVIRRERANCPECILVNAGDLVQGSPVSTIFHGLPVYEMANLLGYDASTLGNHDFDYGWMQARKFVSVAKYPMVSSNIVDARNRAFTKPYIILRVNGLRVGVMGGLTDDMPNLSTPKLMGEWRAAPVLAAVRKYAAELKPQVDVIVLLAHVDASEEKAIIEGTPDIPVIVSGHEHDGIPRELTRGGRVLVRVKSYGEELGRLELKIDTRRKAPVSWVWKRIPVDARNIDAAQDVASQVKHWEAEVAARVDKPLATARRRLNKPEVKRLMERAMCDETGADFAFMNSGGVRAILPEGQLLVRHVWEIMPFDNRLVIAQVKGRELPPVVLNGRTVDANRVYTLAVSDFTAANQSAPSQLRSKGLRFSNDAGLLRDVLIDWFRKKKTVE